MTSAEAPLELDSLPDPAYPTTTPPDPVYPSQTLEPIGPPLDGVATPAIWSRLARPLERALLELWDGLGLLRRDRPHRWVAIHYGRIAINAHGWERLRASAAGVAPDAALVGPDGRGLQRLPELWERLRVRWSGRKLRARLQRAELAAEEMLRSVGGRNPRDLDTLELARGPLDERAWTLILLPWLAVRLHGEDTLAADARVRAGVALEERFGAEAGRRLCAGRALDDPSGVACLTVQERIRAAQEASPFWMKLVRARMAQVDAFVELEVPARFWGRPRVEREKNG